MEDSTLRYLGIAAAAAALIATIWYFTKNSGAQSPPVIPAQPIYPNNLARAPAPTGARQAARQAAWQAARQTAPTPPAPVTPAPKDPFPRVLREWPNSNMSQRGLEAAGVDHYRIAEAEREAWEPLAGGYSAADGHFLPPASSDMSGGISSGFVSGDTHRDNCGNEYSSFITDAMVDPRMADNHRKWVEELGPWSGGVHSVDNLDEALEQSASFVGLRRPHAVPVDNPTQVTELGPENFGHHHKWHFFS